jgi:hypothetical protein
MATENLNTEEEQEEVSTEVDTNPVLDMSDEDISNMSFEDFVASQEKPKEEVEETEEKEEIEPKGVYEPQYEDKTDPEVEEEDVEVEEEDADVITDVEIEPNQYDGVDYKAEYEKLLKPFKAADREIQVSSVEEAIKLMQMGADYTKKMQALKPHLGVMKALEKNELLNKDKINHLIDIAKGKPAAINKLLKDHKLDLSEIDIDEEKEYLPESYTPSEKEQNLDEVLESIKTTSSYNRTLEELGSKWDQESRGVLMDNPQLIIKLNEQIGNGVYDKIMGVVEKERMLGNLVGVPDIAAYKTVGDALQANGAFTQLASEKPKSEGKPQRDLTATRAKKKAAAMPRGSAKKTEAPKINPLSMSDDEFEAMSQSRYR